MLRSEAWKECSSVGWPGTREPPRTSREGTEQLSCKVSCTLRHTHTAQLRKGGSSGGEGGGNSLEARTGALVPLTVTLQLQGHPDPRRVCVLDAALQFAAGSAATRAGAKSGTTGDAICISPRPPQVGRGGDVALRGSVFLAVTLIRCCAATCTESGWASITPVRHTLFWWESCGSPSPTPTLPSRRTAALSGAELGEHFSSARGERISAVRASRRARASKSSPGFASSCRVRRFRGPGQRRPGFHLPLLPRVKFAGENPTIRAKPLGGGLPHPSLILTDGKNDSIGQNSLPGSINVAVSVPGARGGWAPRQETAEGGAMRASCPS